jgi:hypothetical protein
MHGDIASSNIATIKMYVIEPLTTTFTPPSSCTASFSTNFKVPGSNGIYDVMGPVSTDGGCFPGDYTFQTDAYYSPGVCPQGYAQACLTPLLQDAALMIATCCPAGYTCNQTPPVLQGSTYICNSRFSTFVGEVVSISGSETVAIISSTTEDNPEAIANAFGVVIGFQSDSDFLTITSSVSISLTCTSKHAAVVAT